MTRFIFGLLAGLAVTILSTLVLWLVMPVIFSSLSHVPDLWLRWFPFAIFIPALLMGGFTAARLVPRRRIALGFMVGLVASALAALLARGTGHVSFLLVGLIIGGLVAALGARFAAKSVASF